MSMIQFLLRWECKIKPFIRNVNGEDIYGPEETRKCRIEFGNYLVNHSQGGLGSVIDQIAAKAKMFCTGDPIPTRSIVYFEGRTLIVIGCSPKYGMGGIDHLEIMLE